MDAEKPWPVKRVGFKAAKAERFESALDDASRLVDSIVDDDEAPGSDVETTASVSGASSIVGEAELRLANLVEATATSLRDLRASCEALRDTLPSREAAWQARSALALPRMPTSPDELTLLQRARRRRSLPNVTVVRVGPPRVENKFVLVDKVPGYEFVVESFDEVIEVAADDPPHYLKKLRVIPSPEL